MAVFGALMSFSVSVDATAQTNSTASPDAPSERPETAVGNMPETSAQDEAFEDPASDPSDRDFTPGDLTLPTDLDEGIPRSLMNPEPPPSTDSPGAATESPTSTVPESAPQVRGLQGFYPASEPPNFIPDSNALALALPYTIAPNLSIGRARTKVGPFRLGLNLSGSTAYNDNVFGSATNRKSDLISSVTPSFYIETGTRGSFKLLYTPSLQYYSRYHSQNQINQTLLASASYHFTKLQVGTNLSYTTRNGLFADTEGTARQTTVNLGFSAGYRLTSKTQLKLAYAASAQSSDPGQDVVTNQLTLSTSHPLTSRVSLGPAVMAGIVDAENNQQVYTGLGLAGAWRVTERMRISGSAGAQARQLSTDENSARLLVTPTMDLSVSWQATDGGWIQANIYRNVTNNSFNDVQTLITTGAAISATQSFWKKVTLQGTFGLAYTEQENPFGGQGGDYTYLTASISLGYNFQKFLTGNLFYNRQQRFSRGEGDYDTNVIGISLGTSF